MPEGELAKVRASVVSAAALAEVAGELELGDVLLLGKGEDASGGREKPSILADALEAVIGAVYLDGGWPAARAAGARPARRPHRARRPRVPAARTTRPSCRSWRRASSTELPVYDVRDEGPDHEKRFFAVVRVGGRSCRATGEGRSKKQAEQAAARAAWETLRRRARRAGATAQSVTAGPGPAETNADA